jgi:hypothetical protein
VTTFLFIFVCGNDRALAEPHPAEKAVFQHELMIESGGGRQGEAERSSYGTSGNGWFVDKTFELPRVKRWINLRA